ncbi:hypothetical protein N0O92_23220 [Alkalihalobacillus sp. MEB130]|uniref:hypothetical protein n=1 Tax=Alkalihalobacillus sp. MEB130 TaxID=2976704 RepID=UPI0028DFDDA7|nr:hypothetical protein [Alkalihalobacillus sp. MEB130]MDT8863067.1 hypothetical protein [Alkalihalobacillus sp. MEB130]
MTTVNEAQKLSQQQLVKILEHTYKKGSESPNLSSQQLIEEIAQLLKPYVKPEIT